MAKTNKTTVNTATVEETTVAATITVEENMDKNVKENRRHHYLLVLFGVILLIVFGLLLVSLIYGAILFLVYQYDKDLREFIQHSSMIQSEYYSHKYKL